MSIPPLQISLGFNNYGMQTIRTTKNGVDYLRGVLRKSAERITQAFLWKIPHRSDREDISLKIGRYAYDKRLGEVLESEAPKSELTLNHEEFLSLVTFLEENYEPFKRGQKNYIPLTDKFKKESIIHLKAIFDNPDKEKLLGFIAENSILPDDLISGLQHKNKIDAVKEFESMLGRDLIEDEWQKWLKKNSWVLGTDFVEILEERDIDTEHISDYLMRAYDGFLDIVEIKRPQGKLKFWASELDHGNHVPSSDLIKAITQASKYIYEVERESNGVKFQERLGIKTIKPRCTLLFGRSNDWNGTQKEAFRILNSCYHNISIMTYDHVLDRAKRMLGI